MLIDKYYLEEVDQNLFADAIYKGFMKSLKDPYSTYYTQEEYKALMESSSGVYHGIGTTVSQNAKTGIITIVKPFESSPAHEAGLLPGDILYKVEDEEVTGVDLSEVVSRMKGKEGTSVNITVIRENVSEPIELNIVRREIKVPTVEYKMLDDKIGLITILEFDEVTVNQFDRAVTELEKAGMQGLVVDVRNNPGGLLSGVVKMLDRLLPEGLLVYTEDKYGNRLEEPAKIPIKSMYLWQYLLMEIVPVLQKYLQEQFRIMKKELSSVPPALEKELFKSNPTIGWHCSKIDHIKVLHSKRA